MHDTDFLHEHDALSEADRLEMARYIWGQETVELKTIGIDIGSSTSHLLFAKVTLQRQTQALSSRFVVIGREILWRSPIMLTPFLSDGSIDAGALDGFIQRCYGEAGLSRADVDSGAVILTGEAVKKRNARAIDELFAAEAGKFVCATAGHKLEATLAAHGSGAVRLSKERATSVLHVDIGGGTTKLALIDNGAILAVAAIAVGGRLIARHVIAEKFPLPSTGRGQGWGEELGETQAASLLDRPPTPTPPRQGEGGEQDGDAPAKFPLPSTAAQSRSANTSLTPSPPLSFTKGERVRSEGQPRAAARASAPHPDPLPVRTGRGGSQAAWTRVDDAAQLVARELGIGTDAGTLADPAVRRRIAARLAVIAANAIVGAPPDDLGRALQLTEPLRRPLRPQLITFSGGVAEYLFGEETREYGDIACFLAEALSKELARRTALPLVDPGQRIRATVIGASQFTVQVSGKTIWLPDPSVLPVRNIPVVRFELADAHAIDAGAIAAAIRAKLERLDLALGARIAVAFAWSGDPEYTRLRDAARAIVAAVAPDRRREELILLMVEGDVGRSLGHIMDHELGRPGRVIAIDGVQLQDFDFVDVGEIITPPGVVPLVIKSLLFA